MFDVFMQMLKMVLSLALFLLKVFLIFLIPFAFMCIVFYIYYHCKGMRRKKPTHRSTYKRQPILYRLFFAFPRRFVLDIYNKDPDKFPLDGLHLFCGEQGSGKSIAQVEFLLRYQKMYPNVKIASNIDISFQDEKIQGWEDVVFNHNGTNGMMIAIDEIQNWFNSNESKNFPPDMIQEICQLRKQVKCIVGTSQIFGRVAKPIREQTRFYYLPLTIAGCLTIVRVCRPSVSSDGQITKLRKIKTYFFVHDDELRNAYDTYEKVQRLVKNGFKEKSERFDNSDLAQQINIALSDSTKKRV